MRSVRERHVRTRGAACSLLGQQNALGNYPCGAANAPSAPMPIPAQWMRVQGITLPLQVGKH
jgi:hypothetical protein